MAMGRLMFFGATYLPIRCLPTHLNRSAAAPHFVAAHMLLTREFHFSVKQPQPLQLLLQA